MFQTRISARMLGLARPSTTLNTGLKCVAMVPLRSLMIKPTPKSQFSVLKVSSFSSSLARLNRYSTKTAPPPPPPPPPHDKNAKGKLLLNRITRAFTFSLSSVLVVGALGVAILVISLIFSELFLPSGDTKTFNKALKLIEKNEVAQKALNFESGERLKAYGMVGSDRWVRNRPIQSTKSKSKDGKEHLYMKFHVESDKGKHGTIILEQIETSFWSSEFAYIALDMPRSKRVYIVEPKLQANPLSGYSGSSGFLGLKWGPKKDE